MNRIETLRLKNILIWLCLILMTSIFTIILIVRTPNCLNKADLNCDQRNSIEDFSIFMHDYKE